MKNRLLLGVATAALLVGTSTIADVTVVATIDKSKDITVGETVTITTTVNAAVSVVAVLTTFAEADAIAHQANHTNRIIEGGTVTVDRTVALEGGGGNDEPVGSVSLNSGYVSLNQASGSLNNQGNAVSVAIGTIDRGLGGADARAVTQQLNGARSSPIDSIPSVISDPNFIDAIDIVQRDAIVSNSINTNIGVVQVNQATGHMNNQNNLLSMAFAESGVASAEAELGQFNQTNFNGESDGQHRDTGGVLVPNGVGIHKSATISGSVLNNFGIVGVNQAAGNMANQANQVAFAATFAVIP